MTPSPSSTAYLAAGAVLLFLLLYLAPLGQRPLIDPDETRYGEIPREMLASGDWVVPRLNGLRYFEKPPAGYWLSAASLAVFGENPFAVRLPSALATGLTALLLFLFIRHVTGNGRTALLAAMIQLSFLAVYVAGTFTVLDNLLVLWLTAGLIAAWFTVTEPRPRPALGWGLAAGAAFGLAFLTKGFLAFAVPTLVLVAWLLWEGRWRMLFSRGWPVLLAVVVIALPWAIMIHLREGDFWNYFFWEEHIRRFFSDTPQHGKPVYYFAMLLPALAFPWFALLPASLSGLRLPVGGDATKRSALRFLWLWLGLPFLFFSASSGKLATYILPCFPPLAGLTAIGLTRYFAAGRRRIFDFGVLFNTLLLTGVLAALLITQGFDVGFRLYGEGEGGTAALLCGGLVLALAASLFAFFDWWPPRKCVGVVLSLAPLLLVSHLVLPRRVAETKAPGLLLERHAGRVGPDTLLVSDGSRVRAAAWYFKRDDIYMLNRRELAYGLSYPDAAGRLLTAEGFTELLRRNAGRRPVVLVCKLPCVLDLDGQLPPGTERDRYGVFGVWRIPGTDE